MRGAAGVFEGHDFVVEFLPLRTENVSASDDHINFLCAGFYRAANFRDAFGQRRKTGRKSSGDGGDRNAAAFQSAPRSIYEQVVDADGADANVRSACPTFRSIHFVVADVLWQSRRTRSSVSSPESVVKSMQVMGGAAGRSANLSFYGAAGDQSGGTAFDGAGVDANGFDPLEV
jgi:hypothetical protein